MSSHVVLAACRDHEPAKEDPGKGTGSRWNGISTSALKSDSLKEEATYADLICALKMNTAQTLVVAGNAVARLWYQPQMSKKASSWTAMCGCLALLVLVLG